MPTYEYACTDCGQSHEVFQSISAPDPENCPECGGENLRRKIFAVGTLFKGDGFYTTEYRSSDYKDAASKESPSSDCGPKACDTGGCQSSGD